MMITMPEKPKSTNTISKCGLSRTGNNPYCHGNATYRQETHRERGRGRNTWGGGGGP